MNLAYFFVQRYTTQTLYLGSNDVEIELVLIRAVDWSGATYGAGYENKTLSLTMGGAASEAGKTRKWSADYRWVSSLTFPLTALRDSFRGKITSEKKTRVLNTDIASVGRDYVVLRAS